MFANGSFIGHFSSSNQPGIGCPGKVKQRTPRRNALPTVEVQAKKSDICCYLPWLWYTTLQLKRAPAGDCEVRVDGDTCEEVWSAVENYRISTQHNDPCRYCRVGIVDNTAHWNWKFRDMGGSCATNGGD